MIELTGRVAVVTGAASGIGLALAERFVAEGMHVTLADLDADQLAAATRRLSASGGDVHGVVCDVTDSASVDSLASAVLARFGAVHVLCNNAGVVGGGRFADLTRADWAYVLDVNLWGVIHGLRVFLPILLEQQEAHVVNTASMGGFEAPPFMAPYAASKAAVIAISQALALEMSTTRSRLGVTVLCPGFVETGLRDNSIRHRPAHLQTDERDIEKPMRDMLDVVLVDGIAPSAVADSVVEAIHADRLFAFSHAGSIGAVEHHMRNIAGSAIEPGSR